MQHTRELALAAALCCCLVQGCAARQSHAAAPPPVEPSVSAFFQAMRGGQLSVIEDYLSDDYFQIGPSGATNNKGRRLAWLRQNVAQLSTVAPSDIVVRYYGEVAVVTGLVAIADETPVIYERFTQLWAYRSGKWRMVSGQVTAVAPEHQPKGDTRVP